MKLNIYESDFLFEMSNVRGNYVRNPHKLPFSFYFSTKQTASSKDNCHGLRVKPLFNPEKMTIEEAGTLEMYSDWKFIPGENDKNVKSKKIKEMKEFFRKYKVFFAAVWEGVLPPDALYDYFRGIMKLWEVIKQMSFYNEYKDKIKKEKIDTVQSLTNFVLKYNIFNMECSE